MIDKAKHVRGMVEILNGATVLDRRTLGAYIEAHVMPRGEKSAAIIGADFLRRTKNLLEEYADLLGTTTAYSENAGIEETEGENDE